jgi:hypothetical protein
MRNKVFIAAFILHFGFSLAGFYTLNALAVGSQDGAADAGGLSWLGVPVHYVLLQPIAFWLLLALQIRWWTWPGLALTAVLLLANSLLACGIIALLVRRIVPGVSRS